MFSLRGDGDFLTVVVRFLSVLVRSLGRLLPLNQINASVVVAVLVK